MESESTKQGRPLIAGRIHLETATQIVKPARVASFLLCCLVFSGSVAANDLHVTDQERAWLDAHSRIRLAPAPKFPPMEFFDDQGQYRGVMADYAALLEAKLGIKFEVARYDTWGDVVTATKAREVDVWMEAQDSAERRKYLNMSRPYVHLPVVIIVRRDIKGALRLSDLSDQKVAVIEGYESSRYVRENYPELELIQVPSVEVGLERVSFGAADALVANIGTASFYIEKNGINNLRVAGTSGFDWHLCAAVRKDWPELHNLLQRALDSIEPSQGREIYRRWIALEVTGEGLAPRDRILIAGAVLAVLLLVAFLVLRRQGKTAASDIKSGILSTWPVYLLGTAVIVLILTTVWWGDRQITARMQNDVGDALQTVLRTTSEAVHHFFREREDEARVWAEHEDVWSVCETVAASPSASSETQAALRVQLEGLLEKRGYLGYLILKLDGTVLASDDGRMLGQTVMSTAVGNLLQDVLANPRGASVSLPQRESESTENGDDRVTMMLAAAAPDLGDGIPCVLTLLMDPQRDFSKILQRGRIGESGESYAFDNDGRLISASRFEEDLQRIGIIGEGETGILNVEIRDPGVNLIRGHRPDRKLAERPLTAMAQSATSGHTEMDLGGYNDYRGVPVIGAWTWDEARGLGITTEIDVDEAYSSLTWVHRMLFAGTIFIVLLVGALMVAFTLHNIRRRRIEAQLAESEERGRLILGSAGEGIFGVGKDGLVNFINSAGLRMLGFSLEEVLGHRIHPLIHHSRQDGSSYPAEECPMYHAFTSGDAATRDDEVLWRKDRSCFPVEYTSKPILKGSEIVGSVVIFRDITERKEAQDRLNRQSAALEAAADAITITATDGTIRWVNPAFSQLTGYDFDEAIGASTRILKSGAHGPEFYKDMWQTINAGAVWNGEVVNRRKDGSTYTEEMSITPVRNEKGVVVDFVAIKRDITERKAMEAELEKARKRMEDELNVGRDIQISMVPLTFPAFPDRDEFSVFAALHPAREVGGDFYDFFFIDDHHLCLCIGDVSGKGVPAALFMAVTRTLIQVTAKNEASPAKVLTLVNDQLSENNEASMFVTLFLGVLDVRSGTFSYANAGHNPPYIRRADGAIERISQRHGPIVGARPGLAYGEDMLYFCRGDLLLMYTDGVTEAMSPSDELFSEKRLASLLAEGGFPSVEDAVESTVNAVNAFEGGADQFDDITVLAMQYRGQVSPENEYTLRLKVQNRITEIDRVNESFNEFADQQRIPAAICQKVNMSFDELLGNVISYAFDDNADHEIDIRVELVGTRLSITITDDGTPFDPFAVPDPDTTLPLNERSVGGLGIHLVRKVMDEASYERVGTNNVVTLIKRLEEPSTDTKAQST